MLGPCRGLALVIGAALALHSVAAQAQKAPWAEGVSDENKAKAKELLEQGNALLVDKKYVEALEQYTAAIGFWDHPAIRFNMARCQIQLGRNLEAYDSIERALTYGAAPHEETVYNEALAYQKLLAAQVGQITVSCAQAGVTLTLDGQPFASCPAKQEKRVLAGQHQIVGIKHGMLPRTVELVVAGAAVRAIDVSLEPLAAAAHIEHRWPQYIPWSVFGGGLAVAGVGILVQVIGLGQMKDYDHWVDEKCTGNCQADELPPYIADLKTGAELKSAIGVSLMVTGAAAVAAGAVMLYLNRGRTVYPASVEVAPIAGGGAAVSWNGRF